MTTTRETHVREHYEAALPDLQRLLERVSALLGAIEPPFTPSKLAAFDQFHFGGLAATAELARRADVKSGDEVLDAGSGLGGPARFLAQTFGCKVTGVDLSPGYVAVARMVSERMGLANQTRFEVGDITRPAFAGGRFDIVWTQHVVMNVQDRAALYTGLRRVLRPGGRLAFFDPIAAHEGALPHFPVPWAATAATSWLLTEAATRKVLHATGLEVETFEDMTAQALEWAAQQRQADAPTLNLGLVVCPRTVEYVGNFVRSLQEGRLRLAMGVCRAT